MQRTFVTVAILLLIATFAPSRTNELPPPHAPHWLSINRQFRFSQYEIHPAPEGENVMEIFPIAIAFHTLKFLPTAESVTNANPSLHEILWAAASKSSTNSITRNKAVVGRIDGAAHLAGQRSSNRKARVGTTLIAGSAIASTPNSIIDLFLGDNGPILRLTPDTEIELARLDLENTGLEKIIDTRIDLHRGRIQGNVKKLASRSNYLIRTRANLIRIRSAEFQIDADGTCAIVTGSAEIVTPTRLITVNPGEIFSPISAAPK